MSTWLNGQPIQIEGNYDSVNLDFWLNGEPFLEAGLTSIAYYADSTLQGTTNKLYYADTNIVLIKNISYYSGVLLFLQINLNYLSDVNISTSSGGTAVIVSEMVINCNNHFVFFH